MYLMALVQHAAKQDDWRAAAWILELRWPEDYAVNRIDIRHSGEVKLNVDLLSDLRTVVEQLFPHDAVIQERLADALAEVDQKQPLTLPSPSKRAPRHGPTPRGHPK